MNNPTLTVSEQIGKAVAEFQEQCTGHAPTSVTAVLSDDTVVVTMHDALSPAEKLLAAKPEGAARIQEFHRQLFANSSTALREAIQNITGRQVGEAVELESISGMAVHMFTTGTMVQIFC